MQKNLDPFKTPIEEILKGQQEGTGVAVYQSMLRTVNEYCGQASEAEANRLIDLLPKS